MSETLTSKPEDIFVGMQSNDNTKRAYRNDISKWNLFLAAHNYEETAETAVAFKQALENTYAPATAQRVWCTVAAFYGWMKGTDRIAATPFHKIKSPSRPTNEPPPVPSDEEISLLLNATDDGTSYGARARMAISLMLNGLRAQEVCDVTFEDMSYDDDNGIWVLNVLGKGNKWRTVPLNSLAQQAIYDFYLNHRVESNYIVPGNKSDQSNTKTIWRMVDRYARKHDLKDMHPHALRHHYATRMVRAKVDIFTIQKLLGHTRADTTQRYIGLDYSDLAAAIDVDPLHRAEESHDELFQIQLY